MIGLRTFLFQNIERKGNIYSIKFAKHASYLLLGSLRAFFV